jgi:Tfp pilus assembly protein PilF
MKRLEMTALIALLGVASVGCGGGKEQAPAKSPAAARPTNVDGAGQAAATSGQFGMSDAPTSGEAANRPKMNASAQEAYNAGLQAFQAGDLEGARAQFTRAIQADGKAYQAHYSLGVVRERLGDTPGALASYRNALAVVTDYEPAIVGYGVLSARSGRAAEAEDFLRQKQSRMPKSAAVDAALAEVKSIQGDSGAAQRLAQESLKKNPDYRPAMVTIARDHYRTRRLDLALYTLKGILDGFGTENPPRDPNNAEARLLRGLIYREQGSRKPAIDEFRKAIELRSDLVEARVSLAAYLLEAGNAPEASQLLEGAIRYDKGNVLAHLNLGDAYRLLGKTMEARRELEWVASKDNSLAAVHYNLGLLYLFSENVPGVSPRQAADKAIAELEMYKRMKPRTAGPDDTDELITRAKTKKALIESKEQENAAGAAPAGAAPAGAAPAGAAPAGAAPAGAAPAGAAEKPAAGASAGATGSSGTTAPPAAGTAPAAGGAAKPAPVTKPDGSGSGQPATGKGGTQ